MGVGLILWLYMILIKWKHEKVWMKTPDGDKEYQGVKTERTKMPYEDIYNEMAS